MIDSVDFDMRGNSEISIGQRYGQCGGIWPPVAQLASQVINRGFFMNLMTSAGKSCVSTNYYEEDQVL